MTDTHQLRRVKCDRCGGTANYADEFGAAFAERQCGCARTRDIAQQLDGITQRRREIEGRWMTDDARDIMTFEAFTAEVESGMFTDYDGVGCFLDEDKIEIPGPNITPSRWPSMEWPDTAAYVEWFNR